MLIRSGGIRGQRMQGFLILGIKIRWRDEGRELSTRTGTTSWRDGVAVKDGGIRAKDGKVLWKRMRTSEKERKNNFMKERDKLRIWDRGSGNQTRVQIVGDSNLVVNWMNGRWKINNQKFRVEVQKTQHLLDKTDIRPMADHLDLFQQIYRDWNEGADRLTHEARERGACWNSFIVNEGSKIAAVRAYFDGGVSRQEDQKVKNKVGSAYVIQTSERIEEVAEKMEWRTITEVAKALDDDATVRPWRLPKPLVLGSTWPSHFWCGWKFGWRMGQKGRGSARRRTWRKDTKEDVTTNKNPGSSDFFELKLCIFFQSHFCFEFSNGDDKFWVLQVGCEAQMDGSSSVHTAMSKLRWSFPSTLARQNIFGETTTKTVEKLSIRKTVQRIKEEDGRTLWDDEEEACQRVCRRLAGVRRRKVMGIWNKTDGSVEEKDEELKLKIEEILTLMKEMNRGQKVKEEEKPSKKYEPEQGSRGIPIQWVGEDAETFFEEPTVREEKELHELLEMKSVEKKNEELRKDA